MVDVGRSEKDRKNEASVYLSGTWGRIELGDFDGAADTLAIYAPLVGIEQIDGDAYDFLDVTARRAGATTVPVSALSPSSVSSRLRTRVTRPRSCT